MPALATRTPQHGVRNKVTGGADASAEEQARLRAVSAHIPHLMRPAPEDSPVRSIDMGAVSAVATTSPRTDGSLTLMQTSQEFEEIADAYVASGGYERDGDTLTMVGEPVPQPPGVYTYLAWGDGVLAVTNDHEPDPAAVDAALDGFSGSDELAERAIEVLNETSAPSVYAMQIETMPGWSALGCAETLVVASAVDGAGAVNLYSPDYAEQVGTPVIQEHFTFGEPTVDGDWVRMSVSSDNPNASLPLEIPMMTHAPWSCMG